MVDGNSKLRKSRLGAWVVPTIVSVVVFSVLFLAHAISPIASIFIAGAIVFAGVALLKSL